MYKLVYYDPLAGYGTFDSNIYSQILDRDKHLKEEGKDVICIVDYKEQAITHKGRNYNAHRDNVDAFIFDYEFLNT
ncbi:MAG: hypothetical protein JWQ28_1526 [Pedobacter sp.]|jgi:hypothetical protein|nr:hypothetical protein [Pedobacter sp.]